MMPCRDDSSNEGSSKQSTEPAKDPSSLAPVEKALWLLGPAASRPVDIAEVREHLEEFLASQYVPPPPVPRVEPSDEELLAGLLRNCIDSALTNYHRDLAIEVLYVQDSTELPAEDRARSLVVLARRLGQVGRSEAKIALEYLSDGKGVGMFRAAADSANHYFELSALASKLALRLVGGAR